MNHYVRIVRLGCVALLVFAGVAMAESQSETAESRKAHRQTMRPVLRRSSHSDGAAANAKTASRRSDRSSAHDRRHRHDGKREAEIDSLDAELHHDGCFWIVEIEYEVEIEGFDSDEQFVLGLEITHDGKAILDDDGQPMTGVVELDRPAKVKRDEREYKGRIRVRVHKDWVQNDDDLDVKASLVRVADNRVFDVEDESADTDRPGPWLHIGAYGVGISIPL